MIKDMYTDLIYDKRRIIVNWITIIQAPFIFLAVIYLFKLPLNITWAMKWTMAFVLFCIFVKGRSFLHSIRLVNTLVLEELSSTETFQQENIDFISWSKYKNYEKKISFYSLIFVIVSTVISRIFYPEYYRDIFLVLFYADGCLFFFLTLNNVKKYTAGLIRSFAVLLNSKKIDNSSDSLPKVREPLSYGRVIGETFIVTLLYFVFLYQFMDIEIFQYIQYTMALFILYATTRVFIQIRRYFYSSLQLIDTIREIKGHIPE